MSTSSNAQALYKEFAVTLRKAADINNAAALLGWDQEVYMPAKSAAFRAQQLATLATTAHSILTGHDVGVLLHELKNADELDDIQQANVALATEDYDRNKKLPTDFVEKLSVQTSICFNAWIDARRNNDFSTFAAPLDTMIKLKRQQAQFLGFSAHPYNALLDEYEKGCTVAILDKVFAGIKEQLPSVLNAIDATTDSACLRQFFPKQKQWDFSIDVLHAMAFDFEAGRQDYAEHPFTTSFAPTDVRITTRVDEQNFASLMWSSIHEGGHALYEQGLPQQQYGLPLGAATSLGIHESQSRLWENCVGRGRAFWQHFYPLLQQYFPQQLGAVSLNDFYRAVNKVAPSLIRTEADEVTYHFHVLIRYELEKRIVAGDMPVTDIKGEWNNLYSKYLGLTPSDDKTGVLQDVHWSHGMLGYFPTYTLGSFYAAQFYARAQQQIPGLDALIANGQFAPLLTWLRQNIHEHGRRYTSEELCTRITGEGLNPEYFLRYIRNKMSAISNSAQS